MGGGGLLVISYENSGYKWWFEIPLGQIKLRCPMGIFCMNFSKSISEFTVRFRHNC